MTALVGGIGCVGGVALFALLSLTKKVKEPSMRFLLDFLVSLLLPLACYALALAVSEGFVKAYFAVCFGFGVLFCWWVYPSKNQKNAIRVAKNKKKGEHPS